MLWNVMRGRAISPYRSLLWGIIFYESEALATRHTQQPVACAASKCVIRALYPRIQCHALSSENLSKTE